MGAGVAAGQALGPVQASPAPALTSARAALAALQASQAYRQYKANGTLPRTRLGECERELLATIAALGG